MRLGETTLAQVGEPPEVLVERLELRDQGGRYAPGGMTLALTPKGEALYYVSGRGVLDEAGRRDLARLVGVATGYGEGIAAPLAAFLAARAAALADRGEASFNIEAFELRLAVIPNPVRVGGALHVCFALAAVPEDRFTRARHTLGPTDAVVVIRAFFDFQCSLCARYGLEVLPEPEATLLMRGDARFKFHHLPLLSLHANAALAAEAAVCVTDANEADPGVFWTFLDALLAPQGTWNGLGTPPPTSRGSPARSACRPRRPQRALPRGAAQTPSVRRTRWRRRPWGLAERRRCSSDPTGCRRLLQEPWQGASAHSPAWRLVASFNLP